MADNEKKDIKTTKKGGLFKKAFMLQFMAVATFLVSLFLFSSMSGVNIGLALNPPEKIIADSTIVSSDSIQAENSGVGDKSTGDTTGSFSNRDESIELKQVISEKDSEIDSLKKEADLLKQQIESKKDAEIKSLAKLYDGVKQEQLAYILEHMDDTIIVKILPEMKSKNASKVLEFLDPERAAKISEMLLGDKH